jgi:aryl-alcohol dehydrogenase-like predicted oxidoreductase
LPTAACASPSPPDRSNNPPNPAPGKYTPGGPKPSGPRAGIYSSKIAEVQPLIEVMRAVGKERGGKTPAQVALNWLVCKGALPIPGAKSAKQVCVRGGG